MREGQAVNFYQPAEKSRKDATLIEIEGAGESLNKIITLEFQDGDTPMRVAGVKHFADAAEGEPFWMIKGVERVPRGWADVDPEEIPEDIPVPVPVEEDETEAPKKRPR